ncbi:RidA family protein [Entomospira culicis]|uniref:RidA family protein n=1 Tax=Entomospira culicis TaxID=2719989 RepID=UPI002367815C|nr:RidA family protein [Entomospira culicis]WDI37955.1 RidA family protein [Entomospira culicis]WDI39580.1 RidA family protein [Entomospira culicis]
MQKQVNTEKAPKAIGPYAQAIKTDVFIFTSGQLGIDPQTGDFVSADVQAQTKQIFHNLQAVLQEAGSSLDKVVKTTVFLKDLNDFVAVNEVYASFFPTNLPARSAVQVARLPKDGLVEIEVIALA